MKHLIPVFSMILLLLSISCTGEEEVQEVDAQEATSALSYRTESIEESLNDCDQKDDEDCAYIAYSYPIIEEAASEAVKTKLNKAFETRMKKGITASASLDEAVAEFFDEYQEFQKEMMTGAWFHEKEIKILYEDERLICVLASEYEYMGGAHPNGWWIHTNFDAQTGDTLKLKDIFIEEKIPEMMIQATQFIREEYEVPEEESLADAGFMIDGDYLPATENIAYTQEGITIHYNPYDIAPYVMGPSEINFTWEEVQPYLKEGWMPRVE